jgi:mycothiol synthase
VTGPVPIAPKTPLRERVSQPHALPVPVTPGLDWRAPQPNDLDRIFECETAIGATDHPHYVSAREEFDSEFEHSYLDRTADAVAAFDPSGVCVAYGLVIVPPVQETLVRAILAGGVHPAHRGQGLGRVLLAWQEGRGLQRFAASDALLPGWFMTYAEERATAAGALFTHAGFATARFFLQLTRDLSTDISVQPKIAGLRVVPFTTELSARVLVAKNDAFRDHWGSQPKDQEAWDSWVALPTMRGDLSRVAVADDGTVAGFALASSNEDDWVAAGYTSSYVDLVGVTRDYRGRGIAAALLAGVTSASRAVGLERVVLDVDSVSPTGAVGLYQRLGFVEQSRSVNYVKEF